MVKIYIDQVDLIHLQVLLDYKIQESIKKYEEWKDKDEIFSRIFYNDIELYKRISKQLEISTERFNL